MASVHCAYFKECPSALFCHMVQNGTGKELGNCKCGAQTPESGDVNECMYVVVDTAYHHHVLSGCGLWLCL